MMIMIIIVFVYLRRLDGACSNVASQIQGFCTADKFKIATTRSASETQPVYGWRQWVGNGATT